MKIYNLKRVQTLPITKNEAWDFFSSPMNLSKITPREMGLNLIYHSGGEKTYAGQIIRYKVKIMSGISVNWVTEITHVNKPNYFVDEQRFGPYALWHHQHHFKEVEGGVEMIDEVNYAVPRGFLGRLANSLFVGRQVNAIFDHRHKMLEQHFENSSNNLAKVV